MPWPQSLFTFLRGLAMGAADIVPGVSGGTMALILGIYERLINAIRSLVRPPFLRPLLQGRFREALASADLLFLVVLIAGILTAVFTLSGLLSSLLESRPVFVYAFFFGLIVASVVLVARRIEKIESIHWLLFVAATVATFLFVGLTPAQTPSAPWFLFLSGAVAISAMLLPGISGAFVLVLLGKYAYVLDAVSRFDLAALVPVVAGIVVGMVSISQLLGWLFRRYHDTTLAVLAGVMLGALRKVWPWQMKANDVTINRLPPADLWSGEQGIVWVVLLALAGAAVVMLMDRRAAERSAEEGSAGSTPAVER